MIRSLFPLLFLGAVAFADGAKTPIKYDGEQITCSHALIVVSMLSVHSGSCWAHSASCEAQAKISERKCDTVTKMCEGLDGKVKELAGQVKSNCA